MCYHVATHDALLDSVDMNRLLICLTCTSCVVVSFRLQEVDGADREGSGTLQAKKRALLGQKDRLRLLKKMQTGKERVQRKMERGRSSRGEGTRGDEDTSKAEVKPVAQELR